MKTKTRTRTEKRKISKMQLKLKKSRITFSILFYTVDMFQTKAAVYLLFIGSSYIYNTFLFILIRFYLFQVQDLGLAAAYSRDDGTYRYIKKLMALPFLPAPEIDPAFQRLRLQATTDALEELVQYISDTWISSTVFPPKDWSVFGQAIRTNNDVEGWHNDLNRCASGRSNIPFYLLIQLLKREAELCAVQVKLVSERKLQRIQRKKYRKLQAQVFELWGQYANNQKTATQLLKALSYLNGPVRVD